MRLRRARNPRPGCGRAAPRRHGGLRTSDCADADHCFFGSVVSAGGVGSSSLSSLAEFAQPAPHFARDLADAAGAEQQDDDNQDDKKFGYA